VILNISLSKVHSEVFQTNMAKYYEAITNKISEHLPEVLWSRRHQSDSSISISLAHSRDSDYENDIYNW